MTAYCTFGLFFSWSLLKMEHCLPTTLKYCFRIARPWQLTLKRFPSFAHWRGSKKYKTFRFAQSLALPLAMRLMQNLLLEGWIPRPISVEKANLALVVLCFLRYRFFSCLFFFPILDVEFIHQAVNLSVEFCLRLVCMPQQRVMHKLCEWVLYLSY